MRTKVGGMFQNDLTYDESIVMALQLSESPIGRICCHECADCPFINRTGVRVPLEELRGNKRFQHKPPPKIHTVIDGRRAETVPGKRERRVKDMKEIGTYP